MGPRHLITAVTMVVLIGILVLGAAVGAQKLFAPLPGSKAEPTGEPSPSCEVQAKKGDKLRSKEVLVNVFNGGSRAGLAGSTMDALTARGFKAGDIGNAPDTGVHHVQVWVVEGEEAAGRLVARNFGPKVKVVTRKKDLSDGVDVVVVKYGKLAKAKRDARVRETVEICS